VVTPRTVSVDAVTADIQARVRERVRQELLRHGASDAFSDAALFADVDALLRNAVRRSQPLSLLLPEVLGDPATWRLDVSLRYDSHRGKSAAAAIIFLKRRLLMPVFRWLFEYSRDNFERQRRVNEVFFACVQELAIENARLRQDIERLSAK
jgi:hypothetical protein